MQMKEYASKGAAYGIGIPALVAGGLALLSGGNIPLLNNAQVTPSTPTCSDDKPVTRFELEQAQKIATLETEVKLRDANTFTLGEISKTREFLGSKIDENYKEQAGINTEQAVYNATNNANIKCVAEAVARNSDAIAAITKSAVPTSVICDFDNGCNCAV